MLHNHYRRRHYFQLSGPGTPAREWVGRRRFRGDLLWLLAWLAVAFAAVGAVSLGQANLGCVATGAAPFGL